MNNSKIERNNLEQEVLELRARGLNLEQIAEQVKFNHPDVDELKTINPMTISRFLNKHSVQEYQQQLMEGKDPEEQLRIELRQRMEDWEDETHEIYLIMKESLKKISRNGDDWKTVKAAKDTLSAVEQSRKNLVTQVEEGFKRFGQINDAKEVNYIQVNNLLIGLSDMLCSKCRKKLVNYITEMEEQ
jgi:DNA-binding transcriptional MerR regulator